MRYSEEEDRYTLSTGKRFYSNNGILGLGPDPEAGWLHEGYDGAQSGGWITTGRPAPDDEDEVGFTLLERREIAEAMILRWRLWAEQEPVEDTHP